MYERFGPWSTELGESHSPHLSTFWMRRIALLGSARAARRALTRRDWLKLGAAGCAACALPTLRRAAADGAADANGPGKIYVYAHLKTGADDNEDKGIFAVDPATANWVKLSDFEGNARVSRDGKLLAVSRAGKIGNGVDIEGVGVWTIDAEGNGEKRHIADF